MVRLVKYLLLLWVVLAGSCLNLSAGATYEKSSLEDISYQGSSSDYTHYEDCMTSCIRSIKTSRENLKRFKPFSRNTYTYSKGAVTVIDCYSKQTELNVSESRVGLDEKKHRHLSVLRRFII